MRKNKYLLLVILPVLALGSCRKIEKLSAIPLIKFTSFSIFDTVDILGNNGKAGRLKFYFEDGDGDIGLQSPADIQNADYKPDTTNLFLSLYRKTDGSMVLSTDKNDPLLPYSSFRIPFMDRVGQNKILKGTISVTFLYQSYSLNDTVRYDFYVKDRALNESNVASTSEITIAYDSIYTK